MAAVARQTKWTLKIGLPKSEEMAHSSAWRHQGRTLMPIGCAVPATLVSVYGVGFHTVPDTSFLLCYKACLQ